jgi:hypothetical protein
MPIVKAIGIVCVAAFAMSTAATAARAALLAVGQLSMAAMTDAQVRATQPAILDQVPAGEKRRSMRQVRPDRERRRGGSSWGSRLRMSKGSPGGRRQVHRSRSSQEGRPSCVAMVHFSQQQQTRHDGGSVAIVPRETLFRPWKPCIRPGPSPKTVWLAYLVNNCTLWSIVGSPSSAAQVMVQHPPFNEFRQSHSRVRKSQRTV